MKRPGQNLDRVGRTLRAPRPDDYRPAPAPPLARANPCVHGRDEPWLKRCEAKGTHRIPEELTASQNSSNASQSWVLDARWCAEHRPPHSVPVEATS